MESSSRVDKWQAGWDSGRTYFHNSLVNTSLITYYGKVTGGEKGLRVFVPLCGKTVDMKWLSDHGQHVVGVEGIQLACEQFFQEQNLKYSTSDIPGVPNGTLFTAESGSIQIYQCDAFALTSEIVGRFDVVWDRGSLVALHPTDREEYVKVLQKLAKPGARILSEILEYDFDQRIQKHAPYPLFMKDIDSLFGEQLINIPSRRELVQHFRRRKV